MKEGKMKAVFCPKYGPAEVLELREIDIPTPKENELLINIKASAVTRSDIFIRGSDIPLLFRIPMRIYLGILKPRRPIIGLVFSGIVKQIGKNITRFAPGDEVYGMTGFNLGAYAEYTCIKETDSTAGCISRKPKNISFEEATMAVYGGALVLQYMGKGNIQKGQRIFIYGASGTSGTIAVQYGKHLGAEVTAVCSGRHADFLRSLGADRVIDYTTTDTLDGDPRYDFVLDAVGKAKTSKLKEACKKALTANGKYVSIDDGALQLDSQRVDGLTTLIEAGAIKPVLDKIFPLEEIVAAHKYVEEGHKRGGVAIRIDHESGGAR
ncbi:MAG TPA: NAD(P)-dependent alcohol dehydrogenase [bacterium]|nr:NAD(P)-dependent alcohol dehydrogenase [bacterium]